MNRLSTIDYNVNPEEMKKGLEAAGQKVDEGADGELLKSLFSVIDLTSLNETDHDAKIAALCEKVNQQEANYPDLPTVAAICVYPAMVPAVASTLKTEGVKIASVSAGFPSSQTFLEVKLKETKMALNAGANEIDIVLPVGKALNGKFDEIFDELSAIKALMGKNHLKVILETGSLNDPALIRNCSFLAMEAGADFIKTSTGKTAIGATPEAVWVMAGAAADFYYLTGRKVGIKPAGGISDIPQALMMYHLVKNTLGEKWVKPELFRIGASRLANRLMAKIYEKSEEFAFF